MDRALASHADVPNPAAACAMLRTRAGSAYRHSGPEGIERALDLLRRADEVNLATPEVEGRDRRQPESVQNADVRTRRWPASDATRRR